MGIFLSYVFLGLSLSAPMGPINAAQLEKVLGVGFSRLDSWHRSLTCRCYLHGTYLFRCNSFPRKDIIKLFLWSFGAFVLIYTGIESLKMRIKLALVILEMMIQLLKAFSGFYVFIESINNSILAWNFRLYISKSRFFL